jgi:phospholipase C
MERKHMRTTQSHLLTVTALVLCTTIPALAQQPPATAPSDSTPTRTPIKHVVIIVGENRSFDHLFATYQPPPDQTIWNLLSEGIVQADGSPGDNGSPPAGPVTDATTKEGAIAMAFYNVQTGDEPYFTNLARQYTLADNYHQPAMGGTGLDSIIIGAADAYWYSDGHGNPTTPPANQIENPNPQPGTVNYYTQDGYSGGSYSNCSDSNAPGVLQCTGRQLYPHLSQFPPVPSQPQLRTRPLLPAQQLRPRLFRQRRSRYS